MLAGRPDRLGRFHSIFPVRRRGFNICGGPSHYYSHYSGGPTITYEGWNRSLCLLSLPATKFLEPVMNYVDR